MMITYVFHVEHKDGHFSLARIDAETVAEAINVVVENVQEDSITEMRYTTLAGMPRVEAWG